MIRLDDSFLDDVGLGDLGTEYRTLFLGYVHELLTRRVGERLSAGLSDAQLTEFETLVDRRTSAVEDWIDRNVKDVAEDPLFMEISASHPDDPEQSRAEYAAQKWLELNIPDHQGVTARVIDEMRAEIRRSRSAILAPTRTT